METWLGRCRISSDHDFDDADFTVLTAVFCAHRHAFDLAAQQHFSRMGYKFLGGSDVSLARHWSTQDPEHNTAVELSGRVGPHQVVAIGAMIPIQAEPGDDSTSSSPLMCDRIKQVSPLNADQGIYPERCLPDNLRALLFDQPAPGEDEILRYGAVARVPPMNVFAVLDAGRVPHLHSLLDVSGCDHECLFQGKAAQELRNVAPYIVQLGEQDDFTRDLLTTHELPRGLWGQQAWIILRSRHSMEEMRRHLRHFTRVQTHPEQTWVLFRFWEPTMIPYFLRGTSKENLDAFFDIGFELHTLDDAGDWLRFNYRSVSVENTARKIVLSPDDFRSFRIYVHMRYFKRLKDWLVSSFGNPCRIVAEDEFLQSEVRFAMQTFQTRDERVVAHYVGASWLLGERSFESEKVDRRNLKANSRGARQLYESAYLRALDEGILA